MPQTIDLYTPQRQAMADALQLLQQRQRMNEQRRQFDAAQRLADEQERRLQEEAARKAAWEDQQHQIALDQFDRMAPAQQRGAGYNILTGNASNASWQDRANQQDTMTPQELAQGDRFSLGLAVSPVKQAELTNAQTVAGINQAPRWATVDSTNARNNAAASASTELATLRRTGQAGKEFHVENHPQVKAANAQLQKLDAIKQKLVMQEQAAIAKGDDDELQVVRANLLPLIDLMKDRIAKRNALVNGILAQRAKLGAPAVHAEPDTQEPDADVDDGEYTYVPGQGLTRQ